jgi:hypothetical protein
MNTVILQTTVLLVLSNLFMTVAWYAHLEETPIHSRVVAPALGGMGCKARCAAHGHSMGKRRNAADRPPSPGPTGLPPERPLAALRSSAS